MDNKTLETVFLSFSQGKKEMSNKEFAKLTKDCHLINKKFTSNDVDIIFSKVKTKSAKVLTYKQFEDAVKEIASKKGVEFQEISDAIVNAGGPVFTGTKADYNKFHDDKSLYTGVYAKGGPTNVDTSGITITNYSSGRKEADVRGVEKKDK